MIDKLISINEKLIVKYKNNNEQLEKYLLIRKILNTKDSFSKMNIKYAYAILRDLMIPEENLKEVYIKILNECDVYYLN